MADTATAERIKSALAAVEIPGGGSLAGYGGLSDIIVTSNAVAFAISVAPGMVSAGVSAISDQSYESVPTNSPI